uniref:Uncharacterized protein n=1 Tax=Echeneis naucrates TaxID=173247 RepID=A0A665UHT6_ECHNA
MHDHQDRVAFKVFLFITPYFLCCYHKYHDSEEEDNGEPHSAKGSGVFVHSTEEALEECPVHDEVSSLSVCSSCCWETRRAEFKRLRQTLPM